MPGAFEDQVNLGHALVIMRPGIFLDIHDVKAGDVLLKPAKSAPSKTAGTALWRDLVQLRNLEIIHWPPCPCGHCPKSSTAETTSTRKCVICPTVRACAPCRKCNSLLSRA